MKKIEATYSTVLENLIEGYNHCSGEIKIDVANKYELSNGDIMWTLVFKDDYSYNQLFESVTDALADIK